MPDFPPFPGAPPGQRPHPLPGQGVYHCSGGQGHQDTLYAAAREALGQPAL